MTDAEIERIARRYCEKLGWDPDAEIYVYDSMTSQGGYYVTRWRDFTDAVRVELNRMKLQEAIAEVQNAKEFVK